MPGAYSKDLRERVVAAYESGVGDQVEVARRFSVGEATVRRWWALKRKTGSVAPKAPAAVRPNRRVLNADGEAKLAALVGATPDASEEELALGLAEQHGIHISRSTVNRVLRRLKLTRKKRLSSQTSAKPKA
jgi:transposase